MTTQKSLGQIAFEASDYGAYRSWGDLLPVHRGAWERIASAVALECSRICTELAADHLRQAQGGDNSGASDHRHHAALECAAKIRGAIK